MRLQGALPQGDGNGLTLAAQRLVDEPDHKHVAIAIFDCSKITEDVDTGDRVPTVRIRRIEIVKGDDGDVLMRLLQRAFEERTGKAVLPFEMEQDLQEVFGKVTRMVDGDVVFVEPDDTGRIPPSDPRAADDPVQSGTSATGDNRPARPGSGPAGDPFTIPDDVSSLTDPEADPDGDVEDGLPDEDGE